MINVAVIGTGYLGRLHARVYSELEGVELAGVADIDSARAEEVARAYGTRAFDDFREVLPLVDAVSIVTPTETHCRIALEFLKAGKHILLEKPMASTLAEADSIMEEAERRGLIVQVGHIERFNPVAEELISRVNNPGLLSAERISPYLGRAVDVDVTLDLMIHDIDLALAILGSPEAVSIRASGGSVITRKLDYVKAWVEFEGGACAVFSAERTASGKARVFRAYGGGAVEADLMNGRLHVAGPEGAETLETAKREPLKEELGDFIKCVKEGGRPRVKPEEARKALELALKISDKARSGR